jgi:hypothetical protein
MGTNFAGQRQVGVSAEDAESVLAFPWLFLVVFHNLLGVSLHRFIK